MKAKTNTLTGRRLDWAVALALGANAVKAPENQLWMLHWPSPLFGDQPRWSMCAPAYSTDPAQAWPIIDREKITTVCAEGDYNPSKAGTSECYDTYWVATKGRLSASTVYGPQGDDWGSCFQIEANAIQGPTAFIAAMRCFVASHLGDEVDIPDEVFQ